MTMLDEVLARLLELEDGMAELRRHIFCPRCSEPAPPGERWGGDAA